MLKHESREIVAQFWTSHLGAKAFIPGSVVVQEHCHLRAEDLDNRIFCLITNSAVFVTSPSEVVAEIRTALTQTTKSHFDVLMQLFEGRGKIVGGGPAYIGYRDELTTSLLTTSSIPVHDQRVQALKLSQPEDWGVFGDTSDSHDLIAYIEKGELLGLSHYKVWNDSIAHIGIMVDKCARGRGVGTQLVRAAINSAIREGLLPQYRTLRSNAPSMKIAESLGFEHFGDSLVIRYGER